MSKSRVTHDRSDHPHIRADHQEDDWICDECGKQLPKNPVITPDGVFCSNKCATPS